MIGILTMLTKLKFHWLTRGVLQRQKKLYFYKFATKKCLTKQFSLFGYILVAYKLLLASLLKFNTLSLSKGSTSLTQIRAFSITIYACILRFFFCEAKSFQNKICSFFVKPRWFHAILVVFFLSKVSRVLDSCFLAKIHHMN